MKILNAEFLGEKIKVVPINDMIEEMDSLEEQLVEQRLDIEYRECYYAFKNILQNASRNVDGRER